MRVQIFHRTFLCQVFLDLRWFCRCWVLYTNQYMSPVEHTSSSLSPVSAHTATHLASSPVGTLDSWSSLMILDVGRTSSSVVGEVLVCGWLVLRMERRICLAGCLALVELHFNRGRRKDHVLGVGFCLFLWYLMVMLECRLVNLSILALQFLHHHFHFRLVFFQPLFTPSPFFPFLPKTLSSHSSPTSFPWWNQNLAPSSPISYLDCLDT